MKSLFEMITAINKDEKYFDNTLYLQCREYVKLYLVLEEMQHIIDYDKDEILYEDSVESLFTKMGLLLWEIKISLNRIKNENRIKDNGTNSNNPVMERFNYTFKLDSPYAFLTDMENKDFNIRVHQDDIDLLDEVINGLHKQNIELYNANKNLDYQLTNIFKIVDNKIKNNKENEELVNILETLKGELL